jgi:hypothetical protein
MKKLRLRFLAIRIEWHWWFIRRARRRGSSLLSQGVALSGQKLCKLNEQLSHHSAKAIRAQSAYEELAHLK